MTVRQLRPNGPPHANVPQHVHDLSGSRSSPSRLPQVANAVSFASPDYFSPTHSGYAVLAMEYVCCVHSLSRDALAPRSRADASPPSASPKAQRPQFCAPLSAKPPPQTALPQAMQRNPSLRILRLLLQHPSRRKQTTTQTSAHVLRHSAMDQAMPLGMASRQKRHSPNGLPLLAARFERMNPSHPSYPNAHDRLLLSNLSRLRRRWKTTRCLLRWCLPKTPMASTFRVPRLGLSLANHAANFSCQSARKDGTSNPATLDSRRQKEMPIAIVHQRCTEIHRFLERHQDIFRAFSDQVRRSIRFKATTDHSPCAQHPQDRRGQLFPSKTFGRDGAFSFPFNPRFVPIAFQQTRQQIRDFSMRFLVKTQHPRQRQPIFRQQQSPQCRNNGGFGRHSIKPSSIRPAKRSTSCWLDLINNGSNTCNGISSNNEMRVLPSSV